MVLVGLLVTLLAPVGASDTVHAQVPAPVAQPSVPAGPANLDVASYDMTARWDAATKQITGTATIAYRNSSTDTLGEVWLKLYLNAFRSEDTQWMREATGAHRGSEYDPSQPGWIRLDRLRLRDTGEDLLPRGIDPDATVLRVPLPAARAIEPNQTIHFEVAWTSQLPRVFARTGVADDFVMAGQWYPKLAVYDRGAWDTEPWHANAEFFADFGSYSLELTVPSSYATGATGTRQSTVINQDDTTTVTYWADSVSDVAWTAWPGYRTATTVVPAAGRLVELELLAPRDMDDDEDQRIFTTAQSTLELLSRWFGPYPWPKLTLVVPPSDAAGADGMEYPMLVTLARPVDAPFGLGRGVRVIEIVTVHEIAHQWVPLQLATNEAREAWLDEGFADYATTRVLATVYGPDRSILEVGPFRIGYEALHRAQYLVAAVHQPLAQPSWEYPDFLAYGATVYSKGTLFLLTLERTFGEERFLAAMQQYMDRWRWRHPTTADFQRSLEADLGTSLDAYFQPLVYGTGVVEYAVGDVEPDEVIVERRGDAKLPVEIETSYADGRGERTTWNGDGDRLDMAANGDLRQVQLDPDGKLTVEPVRLDNGREDVPSRLPLATLAARLLGLMQAALLAGMLG